MVDLIGWIGNILYILGAVSLSRHKKIGFIFNGTANGLYFFVGISIKLPSLIVISVILIIVNITGFLNWTKIRGVKWNIQEK